MEAVPPSERREFQAATSYNVTIHPRHVYQKTGRPVKLMKREHRFPDTGYKNQKDTPSKAEWAIRWSTFYEPKRKPYHDDFSNR